MPYEVRWHIPERVLFNRIWGSFSAQELTEVTRESQALWRAAPSDRTLHLMTDLRGIETHPRSLMEAREHFPGIAYPNLGWFIIIATNKLTVFLSMAIMQILYPNLSVRAFSTFEAADVFIREIIQREPPPQTQ